MLKREPIVAGLVSWQCVSSGTSFYALSSFTGVKRDLLGSGFRKNLKYRPERLLVLKLLVPSHLYGFELALIRLFGIVLELGQFGDVAMQISKADAQRVEIRMPLGKQNPDIFSTVPS